MQFLYDDLRHKAVSLRRRGRTYSEIKKHLGLAIPKSTLSYWCKDIKFTESQKIRIDRISKRNLDKARTRALLVNSLRQRKYLALIEQRVRYLRKLPEDADTAKLLLGALYWAEGTKNPRSCLTFGNSDPNLVRFFLRLLRFSYDIDEKKFRCTVQCRADQNTKQLEKYWSGLTTIPLSQFYSSRIDPRTKGKPSKKKEYQGVCRINYFSAEIFHELIAISKILSD